MLHRVLSDVFAENLNWCGIRGKGQAKGKGQLLNQATIRKYNLIFK